MSKRVCGLAAGIPVITTVAGTSPHTLFDIQVNDYQIGAQAAPYLLAKLNYRGEILTERYENNVASRIRGKMLDAVLSENTAVKVLGSHAMARTASWQDDVRNGMQALILQNRGKFQGIWASFDGQAYVIDDILRAQGMKKGDVFLVSIDGGPESNRRIADPDSLLTATVSTMAVCSARNTWPIGTGWSGDPDRQLDAVVGLIAQLMQATLLVAGYHQHHRSEWRKRYEQR